ncbi:hypothetical protein [Amycolatopsis alkalitolerans]|uniref:PPE domain-containing protein n=1 Tax=Amycolatopsis alkalitolerans TaxID=2547244 RepID=A0A5C4M583_9PSEU|nr:hypothetical protein [Amycolatopsis alkalitolerans]TNC27442.1 hypothetical protein FG385_10295 [Amycolatopsis alkalitolerans]
MTNPQQSGNQGLGQYNQDGQYVSPEEQLKQELKAQGYDPNSKGFWDTFENMLAQAKANASATQQRTQQSQQLSQGVDYRTGLPTPDTLYQSYDHQRLFNMVQTVSPSQVTGVSSSWTQLANAMATFGQQLGQAANNSGATWKGDAAESAHNFVSGLGTWSDQSGQAAQLAADQVYSQSSAAESAKNTMPEPIPFSWTDEIKSWGSSGPFDLVDNINKSLQKQKDSQDAHDQAVQVMSSYDQNLYSAASKAPAFNPPPTFDPPAGGSVGHVSGGLDGTNSSSYTGPTGGSVGASGGAHSGQTSGSGSVSGNLSGFTPPTLNAGVKTGGSSTPGRTSAQNFQPSSGTINPNATSGLGQNGLGSMGAMPMGGLAGAGGMGGDEAYSSKLGRGGASGFGPGGGGSAASSGSAGAGAQSGARAGGAGAAETAAGAGGRGATGATGRSGMGGMGHGGKGQGGEDDEHQRPSWLIEPDPDDVFGTSERTAPPVIGE